MTSAKISFAFNQKEGLLELRRRQDEAGAESLGKYVKRLVKEHLVHDGDDAIAQLTDSVEHLRSAVLEIATMVAGISHRVDELQTSDHVAEELEALQQRLAVMFLGVLQERPPLDRKQAEDIVRETFEGEN